MECQKECLNEHLYQLRLIFERKTNKQFYHILGQEYQLGLIGAGNSNYISAMIQMLISVRPLELYFLDYYRSAIKFRIPVDELSLC